MASPKRYPTLVVDATDDQPGDGDRHRIHEVTVLLVDDELLAAFAGRRGA